MFKRLLILYIIYLTISLQLKKSCSLSIHTLFSREELVYSRNTVFSQFCQDTTEYFMTLTNGEEEEQIVDLFGVVEDNTLVIEGFINVWHLKDCSNRTHANYSLVYQGKKYFNSRPFIPQAQHNHIRFNIQDNLVLSNSVIRVDLIDNHLKRVFRGIKVCIRTIPPLKQNMAACVYAAKQNSINEMRNWFAFYSILQVDHIIVYVTDLDLSFYSEFKNIIQNGFLILKQFSWPRNGLHGLIIHSNQEVQLIAFILIVITSKPFSSVTLMSSFIVSSSLSIYSMPLRFIKTRMFLLFRFLPNMLLIEMEMRGIERRF